MNQLYFTTKTIVVRSESRDYNVLIMCEAGPRDVLLLYLLSMAGASDEAKVAANTFLLNLFS
jgi:hypothetical protein